MTFARCAWLNEPAAWRLDDDVLTVTTDQGTDFWRETHYGFTRDSGHVFGVQSSGDFTAEIRVQSEYRELYDQAGIMVRVDAAHWIKAGIEMSDGRALLSSVLTADRSDWSTAAYAHDPADVRLRITVRNGVLRLQSSTDGRVWPLSRLCSFPVAWTYLVGPMCCTPERAGLTARFSEFRIGPPLDKPLHDLS